MFDGSVLPVFQPRFQPIPGTLRGVSDLFNALYGLVFVTMEGLFSGSSDQGALVGRLYGLMSHCLAPTARYLVRQPVTDARTGGPTFEVYRFEADFAWTSSNASSPIKVPSRS